MKVFYSSFITCWTFLVFFGLLSLTIERRNIIANAFVIKTMIPPQSASLSASSASSTLLFGHSIKQAGCGVPLVPSGDRLLFDPSQEGMLGGTESLNQRINQGSTYVYLAEHQGPSLFSYEGGDDYDNEYKGLSP